MSNELGPGGGTPEVSVHVIKSRPDLAKQGENVLHSNALQPEDAFKDLLFNGTNTGKVLPPPFDPRDLKRLVMENNTLNQCIEAMVVNIDGTGFQIIPIDDVEADDADVAQVTKANDFFKEPWPSQSFTTQRKHLRRDSEETGNGYLETIRNAASEIVFTRRLDPLTVRICRLSDAIEVTKKIARDGRELEVKVWERERSYIQIVGNKKIFFREFGTSRDINKNTGNWGKPGERLPADVRGTELIHLTIQLDKDSPYGVPRWLTQVPSIVGSRKAEELNLEYFNSGGIPPVMVLLQGGHMTEPNKKALENLLGGRAKDKMRAAVAEVQQAAGDISSANKVGVTVEKFGSEQTKDSLFENYDKRSHERVRGSFRLPGLFLGMGQDFNFATAFASYLVAEAGVFEPERMEFDEIITNTLVRGLGLMDVKLESNKLSITDSSMQLLALSMAEGAVSPEEKIRVLNMIAGLDLKVDQEMIAQITAEVDADGIAAMPDDNDDSGEEIIEEDSEGNISRTTTRRATRRGERTGTNLADTVQKSLLSDPMGLLTLASDYANLTVGNKTHDPEFRKATAIMVKNLEEPDRTLFNRMLANTMMVSTHHDEQGAAELARGAAELLVED